MTDISDDYEGNNAFYKAYADYLLEDRVRRVHDAVLGAALLHPALQRVADLGCGKGNEFFRFGGPAFYVGVDRNADAIREERRETLIADYRQSEMVAALIKQHKLTGAVSLFSAEITAPRDANHSYYEGLFGKTGINAMLIGGFYYEHAKGKETVQENGGLLSYQTSGVIDCPPTHYFDETRITIACPSTLFGEDVFEVWRLLQRPGHQHAATVAALTALVSPEAVSTRAAEASPAPGKARHPHRKP